MAKLDPYHNALSGALFRESTRYIDGKVVKVQPPIIYESYINIQDLTFLNRDLSKVVMLDTNPDSYMLQPDNAIPVEKWKGDVGDKGLVALIPLLECSSLLLYLSNIDLASQNFNDFRPILKEYKEAAEKHHLTLAEEFARREALAREVSPTFPLLACVCESNQQALQKTLKPAPQTASAPSFISRLFGLRTLPPMQPSSPQESEVVMPLDIMRKQAVEGYEAMRKYIEEHGEEILEEDKKREQQMLNESKMSLVGFVGRFGGGVPPPASASGEKGEENGGK